MKKLILSVAVLSVAGLGLAAEASKGNGSAGSRPSGFIFDDGRLTIKPYVSLSYTYDSNIDTTHKSDADSIFCVNPGATFTWTQDRWALVGGLWYRYNAYAKYQARMGENSYGEDLGYQWSNVGEDDRGWNFKVLERYALMSQNDDISKQDGRGVWRDREKLDVSGVLERRFTERWHADVMGQYNYLDYKNDTGKYAPLYGWQQRAVGAEVGFVAGHYTDILIAGGWSDYLQHGGHGLHNYDTHSQVWSIQGGIGSHMTEKITYRALMGASSLSYGGHDNADSGWTYQLSANWRARRNIQFSLLGNSYYQPSERSLGQALKVYSLSAGVSYLTMGDRLTLTGNISYRLEEAVWNDRYLAHGSDYDETLLAVRLGADYVINRWISIYAHFTWQESWCEDYDYYNYDRFIGTVGMRFHY